MKRLVCFAAALVMLLGLVGVATPAHAAYTNSAQCATGNPLWYIHLPYDANHNGTLQAWATVIPNGVTIPVEDGGLRCVDSGHNTRIDEIDLQEFSSGAWQTFGVNYNAWSTIGTWGNTNVASLPWCDHNALYRTVVWFYYENYHTENRYAWYASPAGQVVC